MIKKIVVLLVSVVLVASISFSLINDQSNGSETLDVVVLAGQSNIAYVPQYMDIDVVNSELDKPATNCLFYGLSDRPVYSGADLSQCSIHNMYNGDWVIGGEDCAVAYYISKYTNDDVLVINAGIPGRNINYFESIHTGGEHITNVVNHALDSITGYDSVNLCGWVWCQGESDKTTPVNDYVASFTDINNMFNGLGFKKCYMVQTKPVDSGLATTAQSKIVDTFDNVVWGSKAPATFTVDNGLLIPGNSLHYTQSGRIIVGEQCATAINHTLPVHYRDNPVYEVIGLLPIILLAGVAVFGIIWFIKKY